jgi:hypothetical protein
MTSPNLENLAKIGKLKKERVSQTEFDGLVKSGCARLADSRTPSLSIESRFDLAYNASHALALDSDCLVTPFGSHKPHIRRKPASLSINP